MLTINNVKKFTTCLNTSFRCTNAGVMGSLGYYFELLPMEHSNTKYYGDYTYVVNIYRGSENYWSANNYLPKIIDGKLHYQMNIKWNEVGKSSKVIKRSSEIIFVDIDTIKDKNKLFSFFTKTIKSLL